jgi:hypothetical protein
LVGDEAEDRVGDVAVDAGGDEVDEVEVDEGDGECAVGDFAIDLHREEPCRRLVGPIEGDRVFDLVVEPWVAEPAVAGRVRGGAAEEVAEEVDRVRVERVDLDALDTAKQSIIIIGKPTPAQKAAIAKYLRPYQAAVRDATAELEPYRTKFWWRTAQTVRDF